MTPPQTAPSPKSRAMPASLAGVPANPAQPVSASPAATAPLLPEPPSLSLPHPAALPAPPLKPAALPPNRHPAATPSAPALAPSPAPVEPAEKPVPVTTQPTPSSDLAPSRNRAEAAQPEAERQAGNPDSPTDTAVAAPIPLLPTIGAAEAEKTATPAKPGPGSGGLY
jgi:hypothetical protein